MNSENTNWEKSVAGVVIHENKVLLVRHTYGAGKGMLIIPGGYINKGETPEDAVRRELKEETGITAEPYALVGMRFNLKDWYAVFAAEYICGEADSDGDENSEAVWVGVEEALTRDDVPALTKEILSCIQKGTFFSDIPYPSRENHGTYSFYGIK